MATGTVLSLMGASSGGPRVKSSAAPRIGN
jgi:hypothetical protein